MTILPRLKKDIARSCLSMRNPQHLLAIGLGSGLGPIIPGAMRLLAAIPFWYLIAFLSWQLYSLVVMLPICIGVYLYHRTVKDMGMYDHDSIVWDEFVRVWITLMALSTSDWRWVAVGLVISHILDMWKSWPIRWFDHNVHGGVGIMIDDIVAGILPTGTLYFIGHHWPVGIIRPFSGAIVGPVSAVTSGYRYRMRYAYPAYNLQPCLSKSHHWMLFVRRFQFDDLFRL